MKLKNLLAGRKPPPADSAFGNNIVRLITNGVPREIKEQIPGLTIMLEGENNVLNIGAAPFQSSEIIIMGNDAVFNMGESPHRVFKTTFIMERTCRINIGSRFSSEHGTVIFAGGGLNRTVHIGDDCMFSHEIWIRTSDGHIICDQQSGEPLNPSRDVVIGNHVWLGARSLVFKGARIADNSIVAAMAFVGKTFDHPGLMIGGLPAKIIRSGINWKRENYDF
jgi:Acetyltransferase (isoleucine patch superfamily)